MDYLQDALFSWKRPIWVNRLLLPEAKWTDRGNSTQWSLKSGNVVRPQYWLFAAPQWIYLQENGKHRISQLLRPCANPAKMAQILLQEFTSTTLFSLQLDYYLFRLGVHHTGVSQQLKFACVWTWYPRSAATRRGATQQGAGNGGMPSAVPLWQPGPN